MTLPNVIIPITDWGNISPVNNHESFNCNSLHSTALNQFKELQSPIANSSLYIFHYCDGRIIYTVQDDTGRNQANPVIHTYVCSFLMCRESARTLLSTGDIPYLDGFQYFRNTGGQWGHPWTSLVLDLEPPLVVLLLCGWNITLKITIQRKRTRKIIGNVLH